MRKLLVFVIVLMVLAVSCGSAPKKKDTVIKNGRTDSGIKIILPSYEFKDLKKVYLYNDVENDRNNEILVKIAEMLKAKGVEAIIDNGQAMKYENDDLRIKTFQELMSVYFHVAILKPGRPKGNEEKIAKIKADSIPKLVDLTMKFIFQEQAQ